MAVAWVPVLANPTAPAGTTNKIAGRYGFWMDDECAKVNANTACGKPTGLDFNKLTPGVIAVNSSIYPLGHPSSVNLDIFGSTLDLSALATDVKSRMGLTTIDEIKASVSSSDAKTFVDANKFDLTVQGRAPEFNVFGKSRLYFARSSTMPLGHPFFQFFRDKDGPPYFPEAENYESIVQPNSGDRLALYSAATAISNDLNRKDWPGMPTRSFVDKWGGDTPATREGDQVAWNLLSLGCFSTGDYSPLPANQISGQYVQLANNSQTTDPGFVSVNKPNDNADVGPISQKAMLPVLPVPLVDEVALIISPESYTVKDGTEKYHLHMSLQVELWLPPGYPGFDFQQAKTTIGLTYLSYTATQAAPGTANASQTDAKYVDRLAAPDDNGIKVLWMSNNTGTAEAGSFTVVSTSLPFYISNKTGFSTDSTGTQDFDTSGMITLDFKIRLFSLTQQRAGTGTYTTKYTSQLIPVWDTHDPGSSAAPTTWNPPPPSNPPACLAPPPDDPKDYIEFNFQLDPSSFSSGENITRSLELADPHLAGLSKSWQQAQHFTEPTTATADTLGRINDATTAAGYDTKKLAFSDLTSPGPNSNRPSIGVLSFIPTGMQRGIAGSQLKFQPSSSTTELPDWLLLDLVAPNVVADDYPSMSYMNATAGKININGAIAPTTNFAPPQRWKPLQALLENMPSVSPGATSPSALVTNILNHTLSGKDFGASGVYDYPGEICEVSGIADTGVADWDKETIIRNLASLMTTQSNVFSVWGIAQTVKKNPANNDPGKQGVFETKSGGAVADDIITGERRFQAIVERYVWSGSDTLPGNGHVDSNGHYDRTSTSNGPGYPPPYAGGTWETLDGPDAPTYPLTSATNPPPWTTGIVYNSSPIDNAYNPVTPLMKYRIIYLKCLNE